jgi:hypothetical protein
MQRALGIRCSDGYKCDQSYYLGAAMVHLLALMLVYLAMFVLLFTY